MSPTGRRFSLADAAVLIGATACGMGITRSVAALDVAAVHVSTNVAFADGPTRSDVRSASATVYWPSGAPAIVGCHLSYWGQRVALWAAPYLAAWTLAALALALRDRATRRPGAVAGAAVAAAVAAALVLSPELLLFFPAGPRGRARPDWPAWWVGLWLSLPRLAGFAVVASWLTMAMLRSWGADRGWLDRAGRILGVGWIALGGVSLLTRWLGVLAL